MLKQLVRLSVYLSWKGGREMTRWQEEVERMIVWLEDHLAEKPSLLDVSREVGYSPNYCSSQFHHIVGMTIKRYVAGRRLCLATLDIRDTDERLLDISLKYGYSSQQALTRAFVYAYGCSPAVYRKRSRPVPFAIKKTVLFPTNNNQREVLMMSKTMLTDPAVRVEFIPAHKYLALRDERVQAYFPFMNRHDCDWLTGVIDSMSHVAHPVVSGHTAGWYWEKGKRGYSYGIGVLPDYQGEIPEGFEVFDFPESYYLVFYHPPFDFLKDGGQVVTEVEKLAWNFDPTTRGFKWNEETNQDYQRHIPEVLGYEVLRAVALV